MLYTLLLKNIQFINNSVEISLKLNFWYLFSKFVNVQQNNVCVCTYVSNNPLHFCHEAELIIVLVLEHSTKNSCAKTIN